MERSATPPIEPEDDALYPGILAEFELERETPERIDPSDSWPGAEEEDDEEPDPAE
jgi:hypothetical protein